MFNFLFSSRKAKVEWKQNVKQQLFHCSACAAGNCGYRRAFEEASLPCPPHGVVKKLFAENLLGRVLLSVFRVFVPDPIDERGQVKRGLGNYLAAYGLRVPFLTGAWADFRLVANGITNDGKAALASRCNGSGGEAAFTSIGIGTSTTAFAATQTALQTGVKGDGTGDGGVHALATASVTVSRVTTTVTNDTAQLTGTIAITATIAITESGVFNADTNGKMLCRQTFSAVNVVNGDSFVPTWKISNA